MKQFVALYMGSAEGQARSNWDALDEATRNERIKSGMKAWMDWGTKNAAAIVVNGGPLGKTKRTGPDGVSDTKNQVTGYIVVQADSHDAAARLFENHPHFTIFPGDSVEIMEVLPIPEMPK